jgi:acyl-coenzyme A synthetase/AMP-(fatty) acid ligase
MIFNGINIYPAEIEQTLLTHPAVKDVAVVPIKHKLHQEVPGCVVSLVAGAQMSEMALKRFAADLLGAKAPALLTIAESVPRNPQGKIIRSEIVRLIASSVVQGQAARAQA